MSVWVENGGVLKLQEERKWTAATEQGWLEAGKQDELLLYGTLYSSAVLGNSLSQWGALALYLPDLTSVRAPTHLCVWVGMRVLVSGLVVFRTDKFKKFKNKSPCWR